MRGWVFLFATDVNEQSVGGKAFRAFTTRYGNGWQLLLFVLLGGQGRVKEIRHLAFIVWDEASSVVTFGMRGEVC